MRRDDLKPCAGTGPSIAAMANQKPSNTMQQRRASFWFLTAAAFGCPLHAQNSPATAFVNVNVIPMDQDRVLANHTVVVVGDEISAVAPSLEMAAPPEAEIIDGGGGYLMPAWPTCTRT